MDEKLREIWLSQAMPVVHRCPTPSETLQNGVIHSFFVVGVPPCAVDGVTRHYLPSILWEFTARSDRFRQCHNQIVHFCCPTGVPATVTPWPAGQRVLSDWMGGRSPSDVHVFMLTSSECLLYGACITRTLPLTVPVLCSTSTSHSDVDGATMAMAGGSVVMGSRCYCLLSEHPFFDFLLEVLRWIEGEEYDQQLRRMAIACVDANKMLETERRHRRSTWPGPLSPRDRPPSPARSGSLQESHAPQLVEHDHGNQVEHQVVSAAQSLLSTLMNVAVPEPGQTSQFEWGECAWSPIRRPFCNELMDALFPWCLAELFSHLQIIHTTVVLRAILLEQKVVLCSHRPHTASSAALSVVQLLHPLRWQSVHVPLLPASLLDMLDAPVPLVVGVTGDAEAIARRFPECIVADVDGERLYNEPPSLPVLPEADLLVRTLRPYHHVLYSDGPSRLGNTLKTSDHHAVAVAAALDVLHSYVRMLCATNTIYITKSENVFGSMVCVQVGTHARFFDMFSETRIWKVYADAHRPP